MEKGEVAILAVQFGALFAVVVVVGTLIPGQGPSSIPTVATVFWGLPANGTTIPSGGVLHTKSNESNIYVYFRLAASTRITSISVTRFCFDPASRSGESKVYGTLLFGFDTSRGQDFVNISPTVQRTNWACTYSVQITDSLFQTARWAGAVTLGPS